MVGKWRVTSQYIGDEKMYAVYRLRDTEATDHSGNREYASGYMSSNEDARNIVYGLNEGINGVDLASGSDFASYGDIREVDHE